jgi:CheY-like chemotaxis protein
VVEFLLITGLGLAVVARIVEQLSGQLRAESEVGAGSRFFFTLPMLLDDGRMSSRGSRGSKLSKAANRRSRAGSSDSGSIVSRVSGSSEIDSFVQDFSVSHMVPANQSGVASDDKRLRDAQERMDQPGTYPVTDSSWPIRPHRVEGQDHQSIGGDAVVGSGRSREGSQRQLPAPAQPRAIDGPAQTHTVIPTTQSPTEFTSPAGPPAHRSKKGIKGAQKLNVLVVEDDAINSQILQKRLKMDKHNVKAVDNGQQAVVSLEKDWDVDVVLMDIQ